MKKISTLCLLLITFAGYSQPVLQWTSMAPFGSEFFYKHVASFSTIDTNLQGANQTWNFSTLPTTTDPDFTVTIFDPAQTAHASTFPTANYGLIEGPGPDEDYNFFELNSAQMDRIGGWNANDGYDTYIDPQTDYKFPFTSTLSWNDSSMISGSSWGNYYECNNIGYGTLIVPGKTYNDVIFSRVYVDALIIQITQYVWYSTSNGQPVMMYIPGDGGFIPEAAIFQYNATTGIKKENFISGLRYNNPCTSTLNVSYASKDAISTDYELINSLGAVIKKGRLDKSTLQNFSIDMANELSGLYLLSIKDANDNSKNKVVKFIKM